MPGAGFILNLSTKGINQIKKGNGKKKNKSTVTLVEVDDRKDIKIIHSFGAICMLILYWSVKATLVEVDDGKDIQIIHSNGAVGRIILYWSL